MPLKSHGITKETPQNIMLSAGAYYKNLKYVETGAAPGWSGDILGATSGGGKVAIAPEYMDLELDGASVKVRGGIQKVGETAQIEVNVTEFSKGLIVDSLHLVQDTSFKGEETKYVSKRTLDDEDYLDNIAWVGTLVDGRQAIVILPNALITSAFEVEGKNKNQATFSLTAECTASFEQSDLEHLPYEIYFPEKNRRPAEVSPTSFAFNKADPEDGVFAVSYGIVAELKNGTATVNTENYSVEVGSLTINAEYLAGLAEGEKTFTVKTNNGDCEIVITVTDV
ncbi:MAG: X2-like carbohydrate binding domain-containing protein [Anaerovoracaceae bacterium]